MTLWLIRHGRDGELEPLALEQGRMLMGFERFGDLSAVESRAALEALAEKAHPEASPAQRAAWVAQIAALRFDVQVGDHVAMPRKAHGTVRIGRVTGPYEWMASNPEWQRQSRRVVWEEPEIARSAFPADIRASFGTLGPCGACGPRMPRRACSRSCGRQGRRRRPRPRRRPSSSPQPRRRQATP